ncbi:hypothetical protein [Pseudomonas sp. GXZC]|uniref:hypothetical protein n=1 Tax=Pseudomonas sp. GXZC TaxID=3003351 RepID=UPI0022AAB7BE|nr:hypothetical protein [Pseudomonas sp. GXZC]WAT32136.1 hypothetical protein OZ428_34305 [Pseudomonas sp. GXZC]
MLYSVDELQQTLRADLLPDFEAISKADSMEAALYASGVLAGRLQELDRLGVLQQGQRHAWLADASSAVSARRRALDADPLN